MAKIQLNGKKIPLKNKTNISKLLKKYKIDEKVAIELNGRILLKQNFKKILKEQRCY